MTHSAAASSAHIHVPPAYFTPAAAARAEPPALEGGLSPEEVLATCRSRLESLDGQIREICSEMDRRQRVTRALQQVSRALNFRGENGNMNERGRQELEAAVHDLWEVDEESARAIMEQLGNATDQSSADVQQAQDSGNWVWTGETGLTREEADQANHAVREMIEDQNSGSEMLQIRLQSLMGMRQQAIQLSSNMIQALHQTAMAPINNTRA